MYKLVHYKHLFAVHIIITIIVGTFIFFQVLQSQFLCLKVDLFFKDLEVTILAAATTTTTTGLAL